MTWQPISSAPELTPLQLFPSLNGCVTVGNHAHGVFFDSLDGNTEFEPTYWKHLSESPTEDL